MTMAANPSDDVFQPFVAPPAGSKDDPRGFATDLEEFDPFQIGASTETKSPRATSKKSPDRKVASNGGSSPSKASTKLAPRLDVKFMVHEEVTSVSDPNGENEGSSEVFVEGTVQAQVTSSDALKNSPFILSATSTSGSDVNFTANEEYAKTYSSPGQAQVNVVKIPKSAVGFVPVGSFYATEKVAHMPMLLERKITRSKAKVQIAIQVRSKLSNIDDMKEMSIALAVSDKIASDSIEINVGKGEWDRITRTIIWKLDSLPKGESFMVSARAKLTEENESVDTTELDFPVLLRCQSNDRISSVGFRAIEASGYPATVSSGTFRTSFRIVHRLN